MKLTLDTPIQYLKGVGERRALLFAKLDIGTVGDLLRHFPRDYMDLRNPVPIAEAPFMQPCSIRAKIVQKSREQRIRSDFSVFKMQATDDSGMVEITMFNCRYTVESMRLNEEYIFYGKLGGSPTRREMTAPAVYDVPEDRAILPIYPQTAGLHSKFIRQCMLQSLDAADAVLEFLPQRFLSRYDMPVRAEALRAIHYPDSMEQAKKARARFVFEELLVLSCTMAALRAKNSARKTAPMRQADLSVFYGALPFSPTEAQRRCIQEATDDMRLETPMNRLVQGDVGSGKTLVAAACVFFACQNGAQAAVMAPTEILAEQHFSTFTAFLSRFGVRCALLTGSTKSADRRNILSKLSDGSLDLAVGTHALFSEEVQFQNLNLVITDEQHRFGVAQRTKLSQKNDCAHVLVMSATPIPRTLALIVYGDLKLSVIDELPPGRQPVETLVIDGAKRERAMGFLRCALDEGRQAYIVCPVIAQGETLADLKPAVEYEQALSQGLLKNYRLGLLHGKMKLAEKESVMRSFKSGELQCLVSTTVIEVGVDVPNATIILIENAERFGLSQLHQLRGRVGRGDHKSWCILVTDSRAQATRDRLRVMKETVDGFVVAEHDLKLRGPGDFLGQRQHGLPDLRVASLSDDPAEMDAAQWCAQEILAEDPDFSLPEHKLFREAVQQMAQTIGERPN